MKNIEKICEYFKSGETENQLLGLELEHFICNDKMSVAPYDLICDFLNCVKSHTKGELYVVEDQVLGMTCEEYSLSLEPAGQLEVSIIPCKNIDEIEKIYDDFKKISEKFWSEKGYKFIRRGLHPLVENGTKAPNEFPLIPKKRYELMDECFKTTGMFGQHMMRATASTQISIDYNSMTDAMRKLRLLQIISPFIALLTENQTGIARSENWGNHLIRTQIWNGVDSNRCGYIPNSLKSGFSYTDYAEYIYNRPIIFDKTKEGTIYTGDKPMCELYDNREIEDVEHPLSMFFPNVRLKKFLEFRVADSLEDKQLFGYIALMKGLMYGENSLDLIEKVMPNIINEGELYDIENAIIKDGFYAKIGETTVLQICRKLFSIAEQALDEKDKLRLNCLKKLPILEAEYLDCITDNFIIHKKSARGVVEYLEQSTAKYHNRTVRTLYCPKIFTNDEVGYFERLISQLYSIFDKVIAEYETNVNYRKLFNFPPEIEQLILRERTYKTNIPIARIDVFYNEKNNDFTFCEFNTDGSSAMNEDRELNIAIKKTVAFQEFIKTHRVKSFELFDSWIDELLTIYSEYSDDKPNIVITDFMENSTENEFIIFADRMKKRGLNVEICDIRSLKYVNGECVTESGMTVDLIYRRAVTSDIIKHYNEVTDFINAVRDNAVCLVGDFRTQIVHNKALYRILFLDETKRILTDAENKFIYKHVPYTVSLTSEFLKNNSTVFENKNDWIIKPEDSYGSKGVHAGVECESKGEWCEHLRNCADKGYILQAFCNPYQLKNVRFNENSDKPEFVNVSNLTGIFVYNSKVKGLYSRVSLSEIISTQYSEISLPTVIVE